MTQRRYSTVRGHARLLAFVARLLWAAAVVLVTRPASLADRCAWRQRMCRQIARGMGLRICVEGALPNEGMMVANHLSYLDVIVLGSLTPAVFVAKQEVRRWPLIGWLTARAGTLYVQRESPRAAVAINRALGDAMAEGKPVVVFPEGTTTGGLVPLPFHAALFEAAVRSSMPIRPVALTYTIQGSRDGVANDVCYWGDMTFLPHLIRLMRVRGLSAHMRVAADPVCSTSRNEAAARCHDVVSGLLLEDVVGVQHVSSLQRTQNKLDRPIERLSA